MSNKSHQRYYAVKLEIRKKVTQNGKVTWESNAEWWEEVDKKLHDLNKCLSSSNEETRETANR
jgi:hypothetical protein